MVEATGFLYPFLDAAALDAADVLADLGRSAAAKWDESRTLRQRALVELEEALAQAAIAAADRVHAGGRILAFGNGGSATDASAFVRMCDDAEARSLPAVSLAAEPAVLTALANDIGVDVIFARQLAAHGRPGDVAIAFSTSGGSANVLAAVEHARDAGILTIAIAGYGGGALRLRVDHCLRIDSDSVHRIQEAQTAVAAELVARISTCLERIGPS